MLYYLLFAFVVSCEDYANQTIIAGTIEDFRSAKTMIVGYTPKKFDEAKQFCEEIGLSVDSQARSAEIVLCSWKADEELPKQLEKLDGRRDLFEYVQPNRIRYYNLPKLAAVDLQPETVSQSQSSEIRPNDPFYPKLWGMEQIRAPKAWAVTRESDVIVAVLDTGVDETHEDLKGNIHIHDGINPVNGDVHRNATGFDFGSGVDPATGKFKAGFVGLPKATLTDSHGTHCAGTIGAVGNNGIGVTGVAWKVKILGINIFTQIPGRQQPGATDLAQVLGIQYAIDNGAKVISNSYGGFGASDGQNPAVEAAIKRANEKNIVFVVAAGNDGVDNDQLIQQARLSRVFAKGGVDKIVADWPLSYAFPNIFGVAASNRKDGLSIFSGNRNAGSNFGKETVHLAAPGGERFVRDEDGVLSTIPPSLNNGSKYAFNQGTSMACPHVTGVVALVLGDPRYKNLTPEQLRTLLIDNSRKVPGLKDKVASDGIVDLSFLQPPNCECQIICYPCYEPIRPRRRLFR